MRTSTIRLFAAALALASTAAAAQQLRRPPDPPPTPTVLQPTTPAPTGTATLQPPPSTPVRTLSDDVTRPVTPNPALSPRERCLQTAGQAIQPPSDNRVAASQRRLAATEVQRTARNADATDPTDQSGLRAQRNAQQRAIVRERNAANQQLSLAQRNCIGE
ncbi:hypothetical protein LDO26_03075 [Luteimonas sp. BDR2-5]|uniref:hypothetical protein n=1 Tax=Proluteimonas luteida TaxID=2878685 RepID=UPI001E4066D1|nr:hypothetical protein [Luteimonas sp. BDR2-5]MCD9027196.1 hypothetical protein [Luteimonas sp. BDR2-5]